MLDAGRPIPGSAAKGRRGIVTGTGGAPPGGTKAAIVLLNVIVSQLKERIELQLLFKYNKRSVSPWTLGQVLLIFDRRLPF
jgi:hypothetical protein